MFGLLKMTMQKRIHIGNENNALYLKNHEVKIFVPVDKEQSSRDVHMRITEKYLQCGFENVSGAIAGDLMEPIQTQHSF